MKPYPFEDAERSYRVGLDRVRNDPPPEGQKFAPGERVYIQKDLGSSMYHFPSGVWATVEHTYAHAYPPSKDIKSYCLKIEGKDSRHSWYRESQLHLTKPEHDPEPEAPEMYQRLTEALKP